MFNRHKRLHRSVKERPSEFPLSASAALPGRFRKGSSILPFPSPSTVKMDQCFSRLPPSLCCMSLFCGQAHSHRALAVALPLVSKILSLFNSVKEMFCMIFFNFICGLLLLVWDFIADVLPVELLFFQSKDN